MSPRIASGAAPIPALVGHDGGVARAAWVVLGLAMAVRALVAARTAVPDRDAATYLWMARQVAEGHLDAAFATVFHPLYALLVAPIVPLVGDAVVAGQIVACVLAALAVLPLFALTERAFGSTAAIVATSFYAVGVWFARHPADALSEGPFYFFVAATVALLTRDQPRALLAGIVAALAYGTRPEGAALFLLGAPWLLLRGQRRAAFAFGCGGSCALSWPLGWASLGPGFTLTPKAAFNFEVGVGAPDTDVVAHYLHHLIAIPGAMLEAIGYVALPLAVLGVIRASPRLRTPAALCLGLVLVQVLVVPLLRSNIRFVSGYGILLLPFAGRAVADLAPHWRRLRVPARIALACAAVAGDLVRLPQARRVERVVERALGEHLGAALREGEVIATDMPRLAFYAGLRPPEPRPIGASEIAAASRDPSTRFVAVVIGRTAVGAGIEGFAPLPLPPAVQQLVEARGICVLVRRDNPSRRGR